VLDKYLQAVNEAVETKGEESWCGKVAYGYSLLQFALQNREKRKPPLPHLTWIEGIC